MKYPLFIRAANLSALATLAVITTAGAQQPPIEFKAETLELSQFPWTDEKRKPPGAPKPGITTTYLRGSETALAAYTVVYRFDPGARQPPHSHPDNRSCFVLSGTWLFGYGAKFDESQLKALTAGSYYTEPSGMPHFASSIEGAIVECTSNGPSGVRFIDPADGP
ncbi:MAG: cupin domain-containing protein [Polyangiaceae bacterium]